MNPVIELPVPALKTALAGLGKVVNKSSSLPVLQNIRISRTRDGTVTLQGTDLDVFATYQASEPLPGAASDFLVPFEPLNRAVKGSVEALQLQPEGRNRVRLKTFIGSTPLEQSLESLPVNEYPSVPRFALPPVPVDETFRDVLRQALDCCSSDCSRPVLQNVCLDVTERKNHYIVATDGSHLFCANSFAFDLTQCVLIPDQRFLRWTGFMEDGRGELFVKPKAKKEDAWLQLKSGRWWFIAKQADLEYPKWREPLPEENSRRTLVTLSNPAIDTLLAGVPKLPGRDLQNEPVMLEAAGDTLKVKARGRDAKEWTILPVGGVVVTGRPVSVRLNREYLLKALRFGFNSVFLLDEVSPLDFRNNGRRMIVMPLRPDAPPKVVEAPKTTPPATVASPQPQTPSQPKAEAQPERTTMPRTSQPPVPAPGPAEPNGTSTPLAASMKKLEGLRDGLRNVVRELGEAAELLKTADKENRASAREVEAVREKLRKIQNVTI
ncbi:MAG TPA: hypothetical protein VI454_14715 [Verrucomicrobiae bacterium]|jgi:DNA polymerase III sliding clamp (beta) subunit (PCNA family)